MDDAIHTILHTNLLIGWVGMLAGVVSGSIIGLYFHRDEWLGGYASFPRRMVRLGHISFFGLGFLNILFALTLTIVPLDAALARYASWGFIVGAATMPVCCYLCAWKKNLWLLFPVPVTSLLLGTCALLWGWQ
jgi:hypothetical protein